jgi:glycosyltransferase involved in cell wall biosynthesis
MLKVAAIIPVLTGVAEDYTKLCIESLRATTDWDIIVVSNGSGPKPDFTDVKGVTVHLHTRDQGQCHAVNIGVDWVNAADYLFVVNNDMYFAPGWNNNLTFGHAVFSPNLVEPVDNAGSAAPFLKFDGGYTLDKFKRKAVDDFIAEKVDPANRPAGDIVTQDGFNLPFFIEADLFHLIEGYDVGFDPWGSNSDTDLQTKINLLGITPARILDVLVYHFSNKSGTFDNTDPVRLAAWQHNWDYFREKWGFDRDELHSDVWYNKDMLPEDRKDIRYKPAWAGKYAKDIS